MIKDTLLEVTSHIIVPIVVLFGIYMQVHGEISPGGGFQAGVIMTGALIILDFRQSSKLYQVLFTLDNLIRISALGIIVYIAVGFIPVLKGGAFLDNSILFPSSSRLSHNVGIFLIELGIAVTVFSSTTILYKVFIDLDGLMNKKNMGEKDS